MQSKAAESGLPGQDEQALLIRLRQAVFDPLKKIPSLPADLSYSPNEINQNETYLLQFTGPVHEEWKQAVEGYGGWIGDYIPDDAFIVKLPPQAKAQVAELDFVRWIGLYEPAFKFDARILEIADKRSYILTLALWADLTSLKLRLQDFDPRAEVKTGLAVAVLDSNQVQKVAHFEDVFWIEPIELMALANDKAGGVIMQAQAAWDSGLTGSGVMVAIADTGLDTGVAATIHQDFRDHITDDHIASWPVQDINYGNECIPLNDGVDDLASDRYSGHGTHVAGSSVGDGSMSDGEIKGVAYEATTTFQALEQYTYWPAECIKPDGYYLTGIPADLKDLLAQSYGWGARVQNFSWGGGTLREYTSNSVALDTFIYEHPDLVLNVAAGNGARDADGNGYVDEGSIQPPSTAKNVISIGAVDNERPTFIYYWSNFGFGFPPTSTDLVSDSRQEMAAFSGRGPTKDGRIKPDLVAPGTFILSTKSALAMLNGWGIYTDNFYMYYGGTSMATPLASGAAALVRQYYTDIENHPAPSAALIKATLINSAVDITGYQNLAMEAGQPIPNPHEGWGLINVAAATTSAGRRFFDNAVGVGTGESFTSTFTVSAGKPFKVTLVWSDPPGIEASLVNLVNNLDLRVTAPDGSTRYWGNVFSGGWSQTGGSADAVNNVENVYIQYPAAGLWQVDVIGQNVPVGVKQPFALVVDGNPFIYLPLVFKNWSDLAP